MYLYIQSNAKCCLAVVMAAYLCVPNNTSARKLPPLKYHTTTETRVYYDYYMVEGND